MKVVLLTSLYFPNMPGGVERAVKTLAEALLARGHEPVVICTSTDGQTRRDVVDGVPVHYVALRNVYPLRPNERRHRLAKPIWHAIDTANIAMAGVVGELLDRERPDVLHTNNLAGFSALTWSAASSRRLPIVHTLHDYYLLCPRSTMFAGGRNCTRQHLGCVLYSWPRIKLSRHVDAVVGVSRFVVDRHASHGAFPRATAHVIGNPCSAPPLGERDVHAAFRIGYLGRLEEAKGVEHLLKAVGRLGQPNWELSVGGRGTPEIEDRLRATHTDGRIHFLGHVNAAAFFAGIDLLVIPSLSNETFGMVAVEAFAAGVPVLASRRGGLPEVVEEGVTGGLFEPNSTEELRAKLEEFIAEPARAHAMRGRCLARARDFDPMTIAARYEAVYCQAMVSAGAKNLREKQGTARL